MRNQTKIAATNISLMYIFAIAMCGCAELQRGIQVYGGAAVTGAHAAADTVVQAQKVTICDLPYSAIQRDPQMPAVVAVLCGPLPGPSVSK